MTGPTPSESCCQRARNVLLLACSGAANVGEVADRACRQLMREKCGSMFCLAGLGGDIATMVETARDADVNVVVDGCEVDCGRRTLERHGLRNVMHVRITDLDIEKTKGAPATDEQVSVVVRHVKEKLG